MFKKTFAVIASLCLTIPAFAQQTLLYRISGNGLSQPSYLYGTVHLICERDFKMPAGLEKAVKTTQSLYLEVDMDDPNLILAMAPLLQSNEPGYSLSDAFTPADFKKLDRFMSDSLGMDLVNFKKMKPMVLLSVILPKMLECKTSVSYEQKLMELAKGAGKPVEGLEEIADQIAVFDNMPDSLEARMIMDYINDIPKQKAIFSRLIANYKKGDVAALHQMLGESPEFKGYEDVLVYNRNRNWIPVMDKAMRQNGALFAVGAMHLGGEKGVISLLKKKGFKVEPVK
ncbi:TraB/GumN family protein [Chitinophaga caseinilytica]|uniref:TraB/GumN family protein n=1 Tax=Chitinophaga caseinilytica TaxID=2267521 RepID=A0ABZ2YW75_9BACT